MTKNNLSTYEDTVLVQMALSENAQGAFSVLFERYRDGICAFIARFVQNREEIEDICMISFEKAFRQLSRYNPDNKFPTWLFTIAKNTALDSLRGAGTGGPTDDSSLDTQTLDVPDEGQDPEGEIIQAQDHEHLLSCIENLPEHYRSVAKMRLVDNLGYKEISEEAGIPINTVKTRVARAKGLLERMMSGLE